MTCLLTAFRAFWATRGPTLSLLTARQVTTAFDFGTLPLVQDFLSARSRFYLDDALRDDEREVARRWAEMPGLEILGISPLGKGLLVGTASPVPAPVPEPQGVAT